jgi:hypothetical protein
VSLTAVVSGNDALASDLNQYRNLYRGGSVYDVRNGYGAVGDGTTDDQPAIQAAIAAAGAAGGGVVYFPAGTYKLSALAISAVGAEAHLHIPYNGITLAGQGASSVLYATDTAAMIYVGSSTLFLPDATVYTMTATAQMAMTTTLATPANAGNFAAGDWCYIRTGQTITGSREPDAEINRIVSASAGTGVLTLAYPTAKAYAQEYYISGTSGRTTTTPTANLAPFGVAKVTDRVMTDLTIRDLNFVHTGFQYVMYGAGQVVGLTIENCQGTLRGGFMSLGNYRFSRVTGCRFHHTGTGAQTYTLTTATGCSDVQWTDNLLSGERVIQLHVAEGAANVRIIGNSILSAGSATDENQISVHARAYDIQILGNHLAGSPGSNAIYVEDLCDGGGTITGNTILSDGGTAIQVAAANWHVTANRTPNAGQSMAQYTGSDSDVRYLSAWVTTTHPEVILGVLPEHVYVSGVSLWVLDAFNSSGTDTISVGADLDHTIFGTATDVSTAGLKVPTPGSWTGYGFDGRSWIAKAYYVAGGGAPSTGKVLAVLAYAHVPVHP